ncbi:hypothetical protein SLA2020_101250 [Shorea laevis]
MAKRIMSSDDNIEKFPDEVLSHIISFLPVKDAVRTSILSRRWRYLFTTISSLDYVFDPYDGRGAAHFMNSVNRLFFLSEKLSILRFSLRCYIALEPLCIDGWIRALMCRNVQVLDMGIKDVEFDALPLPTSLFSCKTLVILKLDFPLHTYDFKVPQRVCLPSVKVTHLQGFAFSDNDSSERLFSSCPTLEDLVLQSCCFRVGCDNFCVSNSSLKRLTIRNMLHQLLPTKGVQLVINAPSLIYFEHTFPDFYSYQFLDVQSLTEAVISHRGEHGDSMIHSTEATDLLNGLKNVRSLQISSDILVYLCHHRILFPDLCKMTHLKILRGEFDMAYLIYILLVCHSIETLVLQDVSDKCIDAYFPPHENVCIMPKLKEIEILSFRGEESPMKLVKWLLIKACALEKLTIRITLLRQHSKIMKELLVLPRVSKKCCIVIV